MPSGIAQTKKSTILPTTIIGEVTTAAVFCIAMTKESTTTPMMSSSTAAVTMVLPTLEEIRRYSQEQLATIWDEVKRFENPHAYYVDLSEPLWQLKQQMLDSYFGAASN